MGPGLCQSTNRTTFYLCSFDNFLEKIYLWVPTFPGVRLSQRAVCGFLLSWAFQLREKKVSRPNEGQPTIWVLRQSSVLLANFWSFWPHLYAWGHHECDFSALKSVYWTPTSSFRIIWLTFPLSPVFGKKFPKILFDFVFVGECSRFQNHDSINYRSINYPVDILQTMTIYLLTMQRDRMVKTQNWKLPIIDLHISTLAAYQHVWNTTRGRNPRWDD